MDERQFINEIAEIIETEPSKLTLASDFREASDFWSSLTGFGILVFMQDKMGVEINIDDFLEMNTINELYALTVKEK